METQIRKTEKGFVAQVSWSDGTKINSRPMPTSVQAQDWLLDQVAAQKGHIYRDSPIKKVAVTLAAVALIFSTLPAAAQYTPPDNGGPTTTVATGTR